MDLVWYMDATEGTKIHKIPGTKTHAIEVVRFLKQYYPEWWPRLARVRCAHGKWWWYCHTAHIDTDTVSFEV